MFIVFLIILFISLYVSDITTTLLIIITPRDPFMTNFTLPIIMACQWNLSNYRIFNSTYIFKCDYTIWSFTLIHFKLHVKHVDYHWRSYLFLLLFCWKCWHLKIMMLIKMQITVGKKSHFRPWNYCALITDEMYSETYG